MSKALSCGAVFLTALLLIAAAPAMAAQEKAGEFLENLGDEAIKELTDNSVSKNEREERFRSLFTKGFDVPTISRFVLSRYWRSATEQQQQQFLTVFEEVITQRFLPLFSQYSGQEFNVTRSKQDSSNPDIAIVSSKLERTNGEPVQIDWRLRQRDGKFKILDVAVEGVSMAITLRSEYGTVIRRNGGDVGALIKMLQDKVAGQA